MPARLARNALFDALAEPARALASGRRAEILELLAHGERTVDGVAREIDQSTANTSHHLRVLAAAGLLRATRRGSHVVYRLASDRVAELWHLLRDVAADHVPGVDRLVTSYLGDRSEVPHVERHVVAARLDDPALLVVDARPVDEYAAARIPGATRASRVTAGDAPDDAELVVYARSRYCPLADSVVRELRRQGRRAARLQDGFAEWRQAGLPVETG